jgi:hypothetical protein
MEFNTKIYGGHRGARYAFLSHTATTANMAGGTINCFCSSKPGKESASATTSTHPALHIH